jgi:hypothetical protein
LINATTLEQIKQVSIPEELKWVTVVN